VSKIAIPFHQTEYQFNLDLLFSQRLDFNEEYEPAMTAQIMQNPKLGVRFP
jgi:hypothetical protein